MSYIVCHVFVKNIVAISSNVWLYTRLPWERPVLDPEAYTGDDYDLPETSVQYYVAGTEIVQKVISYCKAQSLMLP